MKAEHLKILKKITADFNDTYKIDNNDGVEITPELLQALQDDVNALIFSYKKRGLVDKDFNYAPCVEHDIRTGDIFISFVDKVYAEIKYNPNDLPK